MTLPDSGAEDTSIVDPMLPNHRSEPDFMPRLRRIFADGLPERVARMRRGLDGVAAAVAAGVPPGEDHLEELFLASHSLKGTAPGFGALDLGTDAGTLSAIAQSWGPEAPPSPEGLERARYLIDRIEAACREVIARTDAGSGMDSTPDPATAPRPQ